MRENYLIIATIDKAASLKRLDFNSIFPVAVISFSVGDRKCGAYCFWFAASVFNYNSVVLEQKLFKKVRYFVVGSKMK